MTNYGQRILGPTEVFDYAGVALSAYPAQAMATEPFVGFKVLCEDKYAQTMSPHDRILQIESGIGFMSGKGCLIRETDIRKPNGFWVITLPVPKSQIREALNNLYYVLTILGQYFGIVRHGMIEICVSGKCSLVNTDNCISSLAIPRQYLNKLIQPENTCYRLGKVIRINNDFILFRTRWNVENMMDDCMILAQLISSMYH